MRALIHGAGIMGLSTAAELARRGVEVTVRETGPIPNRDGASFGDTRIYRAAYFEGPEYVSLARRSITLWEELEARSPTPLLVKTGVLYMGAPESPLMSGVRRARDVQGVEVLAGDEVSQDWQIPRGFERLWEPTGGAVYASRAVLARLAQCQRAGVKFEPFSEGEPGGADITIVAAGVGSTAFDPNLPLREQPMETHIFTGAVESIKTAVFACQMEDGSFFYGFPPLAEQGGFKAGSHTTSAEASTFPEVSEFLRTSLPDLEASHSFTKSCSYDMTPDGHFLVGEVRPGIIVMAGFSGHGFKFAPALAEAVADLVEGKERPDLAFLSPSRFG